MIQVGARVFLCHARHGRNAELRLDRRAEGAGRDTVSSRLEAGTRDKEVGLGFLDRRDDPVGEVRKVLSSVVVATDDRFHDLRVRLQKLLEEASGADRAVAYFRCGAGESLAAGAAGALV